MRFQTLVSVFSAAAISQVAAQTGQRGDADKVTDNPTGAVFKATLPTDPFFKAGSLNGNARGSISAVSAVGGEGVQFTVKFENLPKEGGPFGYHIHDAPVPADGNCTTTLAHLDPYIRGEDPVCDKTKPATCQVGDLSGKFGKIESDPFEATYVDKYASLKPGIGAYFGNRSFVLHFANKTRISCANFLVIAAGTPHPEDCTSTKTNTTTPKPTGGIITPPTATTTRAVTAAASISTVSLISLMGALAAIMMTL